MRKNNLHCCIHGNDYKLNKIVNGKTYVENDRNKTLFWSNYFQNWSIVTKIERNWSVLEQVFIQDIRHKTIVTGQFRRFFVIFLFFSQMCHFRLKKKPKGLSIKQRTLMISHDETDSQQNKSIYRPKLFVIFTQN